MLTNVMPMLRCQKVRHPYNEVKIIFENTLHRALKHKTTVIGRHSYQMHCPISMVYFKHLEHRAG